MIRVDPTPYRPDQVPLPHDGRHAVRERLVRLAEHADGRPTDRARQASLELVAAASLLGVVTAAGVFLSIRPNPGAVDGWFLTWLTASHSPWFSDFTTLRYPSVIVVGAVLLGALAVTRDVARALGCLIGPPAALLLGELVVKPMVGRTLGGVLSFPSGTTVGAAALATAAVLAAPARWRPFAIVVGAGYAVWMAVSVVVLGWHLPTDSLAGLCFGAGVVLGADGAAWYGVRMFAQRLTVRGERRPDRAGGRPDAG